MSYLPVIPSGGQVGWNFLTRTREDQQRAFDSSGANQRATEYFRENIGKVETAEQLVADRRLLSVALGAFGLDDDIENRFFIRKVLEEGTLDDRSFANRLSDKRYFAMAKAFAFDLSPPNTAISDFPDEIIESYRTRQFEIAVGTQDEDLRLALGIEREIVDLAGRGLTEDAAWFTIMGNPPVRRVFETALGLPAAFGAIDVDRQLDVFREKSERVFGTSDPAAFADPELRESLIRTFLFRADLAANATLTSRSSVALTLLQSQPPLF